MCFSVWHAVTVPLITPSSGVLTQYKSSTQISEDWEECLSKSIDLIACVCLPRCREWYLNGNYLVVIVSVAVILPLALMKQLGKCVIDRYKVCFSVMGLKWKNIILFMAAIYILIKDPEETFNTSQNQFREDGSWQTVNFGVLVWRTGLITSDSHDHCPLQVICSIASKVDQCCCSSSYESDINELFVFKDTWDTPAVSPSAAWCSSSSRYVTHLDYGLIFACSGTSDCHDIGLFWNKICHLPLCLLLATNSWLCIKFKLQCFFCRMLLAYFFLALCQWPTCFSHSSFPMLTMCVIPLHLTGYLQEVHCPLSICWLCVKCHCHWAEFERHVSRRGGWHCMYTQNGQPQHPSRCTHVTLLEKFTSTFTAMAADKHPLYASVILSMMPVRVHNPSMKITHSLKPSVLSGGHQGSFQAVNERQVSRDALWPLAQHCWCSASSSEIISFAHHEQGIKLSEKA